jgi:hypothetical protein
MKRVTIPTKAAPVDAESVKRLQDKWIESKSAHERARLEKAEKYARFWAAVEGKPLHIEDQPDYGEPIDFTRLPIG